MADSSNLNNIANNLANKVLGTKYSTNTDLRPNVGSQMNDTWDNKFNSAGSSTDGQTTTGTDNTSSNVNYNDVVKNKKLAEVTMAEKLRETYNLTFTFPKILKGMHTNQFLFIDLNDEFYEKNYPDIINAIADRKFARFAGFKKGRFFIEKIVEKGGVDGMSMEITVNPIPPSLAIYSKMQQEATKALIQAINTESGGGGTGGTATGGNTDDATLIAIGNDLASKYTFCSGACQAYSCMKTSGCGSCFAWSGALYTELKAAGYTVRVVQYAATGGASNHMSVEYNNNGVWTDYPYRSTNIDRLARDTGEPGPHRNVVLDENGQGATHIL